MCNFKGFPSNRITYTDFDKQLNILSGPNGFGKTTIFDAVELVFSHEMTRFNGLENGNQKFENHLLLNDSSKKGFLCIDIVNEDNSIKQYAAIINNSTNYKFVKVIETSIKYYLLEKENILVNWEENTISDVVQHVEENGIKITTPLINNFNVCYYVSQEESTHLLKMSIKEREDILSPLIGKELFENKYSLFNNTVDLFNYDETRIHELIHEIKTLNYDEKIQPVEYQQIFPDKKLKWDTQQLVIDKNISSYINSLNELKYIYPYANEIKQYYLNKKIENLVRDPERNQIIIIMHREGIKDIDELVRNITLSKKVYDQEKILLGLFSQLEQLLSREILDKTRINESIEKINEINQIISDKENEIIGSPEVIIDDLLNLSSLLTKRVMNLEMQDRLSNEKMNLEQSRKDISENLKDYTKLVNTDEVHCPVCYTKFDSLEELDGSIKKISQLLESILVKENSDLKENLESIKLILSRINIVTSKMNPQQYLIDWQTIVIEKYTANQYKTNQLNQLLTFIRNNQVTIDAEYNWIDEIKAYKKDLKKEFINIIKEIDLEDLINRLGHFLEINGVGNLINFMDKNDRQKIDNKINYLTFLKKSWDNKKYQNLRHELEGLVKEKLQWEKLSAAYTEIERIINLNEKKLKKTIVEAIRIPMLVYTAKMLQNYQGGLGVYIDENALRFISSEKQPDILNKFSSGQLSAFILTFLLLMNKLYINENEQYQFLLIDDPVQTMDEINLSSFVDILRREFADKQIIMSTHEEDKKNYIGYKFIKHGASVNVINVKDEFYYN